MMVVVVCTITSCMIHIDTRETLASRSLARLAPHGFYSRQHSFQIFHCCCPFELVLDALRLGEHAPPVCNFVQTISDQIFADRW